MWINPDDPANFILADDGGAVVTFDKGNSWSRQEYATGQFYRINVDNQFPYRVYAGQQDNTSIAIASRELSGGGITRADPFDELRYRSLPARSVVVATTPQTVFRHVELQSAERTRPDLLLVPLPFLRYPGVAEAVVSRAPSTAALVDAYMARDALDPRALIQLARVRPVFVELDTTHISPSDYFALTPAGPLYRVLDHPSSRPAWPELVAAQERSQRGLLRALPHIDMDLEAKRQVLWLHYTDALYFAALGHRKAAQRSLAAGARLYPNDVHLRAMQKALATSQADGPIDVTPFLRVDSLLAP
jgi:hypothetical protein